ncbi:ABC transporter ATP-binding protein [Streptosporangium sp. 'caverna']|uniref:ABC transporter ATP-binding protein n=1 Tax=Streptosporangium sp. 'caverna' TaxID=2202249 RepID=UPI001EF9A974|nr:ABC transporter ATP-binding protein [Streptosporangium sp. 'caverna']
MSGRAGGNGELANAGSEPGGEEIASRVRVRNLAVVLERRSVLSGIDLDVRDGDWLAVIGANGAGKSTLLKAMAGVLPCSGEVLIDDAPVRRLKPRDRARLIAYAPQSPALPVDMTVFDYALLGRTPYIPYLGRESRHDREVTASVLDRLDLSPFASRTLGHLSGGERQRVVLARALVQQAPVLLLDEPTTALDLGHQQQVLELVDRLRLADGLTVVTTLHDLSLAGQYADSMTLLSGGRVAAAGTPAEVLTGELIGEHFDARVRVATGPGGRPEVHLERP